MKKIGLLIIPALLSSFPLWTTGAEQVIPEKIFREAGLQKLTADELAVLENWIKGESKPKIAETKTVVVTEELPKGDDAFGVEQVEERMAKIIQAPTDRIETRIKGNLRGWGGGTYFYLENGQVWKQIDNSSMRYNLDNAEVVLFKGTMGTYFLKPEKLNSKVRVRRVE